jgi:hypothetical protein
MLVESAERGRPILSLHVKHSAFAEATRTRKGEDREHGPNAPPPNADRNGESTAVIRTTTPRKF